MKVFLALLMAVGSVVTAQVAEAGCNRGTFYCEAHGRRLDGQWVGGQASSVQCAGTQGVLIHGILTDLCDQALWNCVSQFNNQNIGMRRCQVSQAYYRNNNGHFPQNQFVGRSLRN